MCSHCTAATWRKFIMFATDVVFRTAPIDFEDRCAIMPTAVASACPPAAKRDRWRAGSGPPGLIRLALTTVRNSASIHAVIPPSCWRSGPGARSSSLIQPTWPGPPFWMHPFDRSGGDAHDSHGRIWDMARRVCRVRTRYALDLDRCCRAIRSSPSRSGTGPLAQQTQWKIEIGAF